MKAAFPHLTASGAGRVINFGSYWGQVGYEGSATYNAAKAAIRGLARTAARDRGRYGVTANVFHPAIASDALKSFVENPPAHAEQPTQAIPSRTSGHTYAARGQAD